MTVRVGFVGAGFIARIHTLFLGAATTPHEIVAVCDADAERAASFAATHGGVPMSLDDLVACCDAVFVTTWTSAHRAAVERAAAAGCAVFCEKPLDVDAAGAQAIADAVAAAGVVNQVGLVLRSLATFRLVRHLLADERAGRPLAVSFRDDQFLPVQGQYGSDWRADPARAGRGTLLEHSIHDVDVLAWWLGPVERVSGVVREVHGLARIDDVCVARIEFASGAVASLTSVWHDVLERPSMRHIEVFTERLWVAIEGDWSGPVRWRYAGEVEQCLEGDALVAHLAERGDPQRNPAEGFLAAVAAGTPADPAIAEALVAHRIVDAIYASASAGGAPVPVA